MTLSKTKDVPTGHRRKLSDEQDTTSYSPGFFSLTRRTATDDKNNSDMVMSPIHNLNSHAPRSPSEKMAITKKHRYHNGNRPRSKSESETSHNRSAPKKKGTNSPGGHYYHPLQSPTSVTPYSPKYRSLGKMWIRPVSVKKNQWNQVIGPQQGTSPCSHPPTMPLFPDFGGHSTPFSEKNHHEGMMLYTTSKSSSFDSYQRNSESSSKKLAFTFGESGKPITSSLAKRHSPTSVI
mmetsp:Transcript_17129/g.25376  ORF Transcript_17129/g.25376 Transcript_17129/m.25376 type:complete len:235 (+) Transcript_17129:48-752(+)